MAPSGRTRARPKTTRKARSSRTQFKKQSKKEETITSPNSPSNSSCLISSITDLPKIEGVDYEDEAIDVSTISDCCSTPKGQKFRIPEILTCPPAPKKPRVVSNCLFKRSPIAFFAPPDLELFFHFANSGISV